MRAPPTPENEPARLESLRSLDVLDTPSEERFDRITRLARALFDAPIALVSLVDENRQWFKSKQGLVACETSRDISFCGHAILTPRTMWVEDALEDELFLDNPLVTGPPFIRFYAGCPLLGPGDQRLGTLCVIDTRPRPFSQKEAALLADLAHIAEQELSIVGGGSTGVQSARYSPQQRRPLIDSMTGVWNRTGLLELMPLFLAECAEQEQVATVIVGAVSEVSPEARGAQDADLDLRLADVAQELRTYVRATDTIGRIADREFSIILSGCSAADAVDRVSALRARVEESYTLEAAGLQVEFDYVVADPAHEEVDLEALLRAASPDPLPGESAAA